MWPDIIYKNDQSFQEETPGDVMHWQNFTNQIAEGLYTDIRRLNRLMKFSDSIFDDFGILTDSEKLFWHDCAAMIPEKFRKLNLFIRPFEGFCRTCIITENEIESLVQMDLIRYCRDLVLSGLNISKKEAGKDNTRPDKGSLQRLIKDWKRFSRELNYLIPYQLKRRGYEIIRHEEAVEINIPMVKKLARAIHSKYLHELRSRHTGSENDPLNNFFYSRGDSRYQYVGDFDELPDDIKYSNIDNAAHIPTKLLSVGYKIRPVKEGFKPVALHLSEDEIEIMAMIEHVRWSWEKRLNGWTYNIVKDEPNKTHPGLVPYGDLSESEKEKDRELVRLIPSLLKDIDYEAFPVDTRRIRNLSYALKPQSVIHKILNETRELNDHIRKLVTLSPSIEEMVRIRNRKIEEAIKEVEASYHYAQHIQETFLPDDLFVRECFPDSFILFKPKDIVSGDFYFFSKQEDLIIFAVADCTGHGIPGALLSTIGYGILDQAVNEIKLTDASAILFHLYSKIHRFLRNESEESGLSDDMDIVLCILDIRTNILTYSGVKNPLYHITKGNLIEYKAKNSSEEYNLEGEGLLIADSFQLRTGDTIYLCSDGYIDQFGGKNHKKFLAARFKSLLQGISSQSMPEQGDLLFEEIEHWRDENHEDQTDDILVIGIRI
jgi:serine phosphatase RsbU (regulator of sigma subunit)